jgi:hypothetical protein
MQGDHEALPVTAEGVLLSRDWIRGLTGLTLGDEDMQRLARCIPGSSVPDAIGTIICEAMGLGLDADAGVVKPGDPIPPEQNGGMAGFVVGECGHRVAGSEWRAGFRNCERCG